MNKDILSRQELRARIEAKIRDARNALQDASATIPPGGAQRGDYDRIIAALDDLERRVGEAFAEDGTREP